jgi:alpha-glucuronidase
MKSGRTLWEELIRHYDRGVAAVAAMAGEWQKLKPYVDDQRFTDTAQFLAIQQQEAKWWRDASIAYWQSVNHLALPPGTASPEHSLDYYKSLDFPEAPAD